MEEQLLLMNEMDRRFKIGDEIEGEILSIKDGQLQISLVGYKSDGVIPFKELTSEDKLNSLLESLNVGDKIKAKVIKLKNEDNYVVLSRLEYEKEETLNKLEELFNSKSELNVVVKEVKEKGLVSYYNGIRIFIPASQIDTKYVEDKESLVGTTLTVRLIDFSRDNLSKIVASRRVILEEIKAEKEKLTWDSLHEGDIVKAEIKRFTKFGAFAEINGIDGLIHLSQLSWKHVNSCEEILNIGDVVDVKILSLDKEQKKLSLSIKALTPEPWSVVNEKYSVNSAVLGKVVRINDFGAFVELEPGIDGLVHISKISHDHIKHPSEVLKINEEVKCIILSIDSETKRIALSIKDAQ
jgi:ribosomal protein S1